MLGVDETRRGRPRWDRDPDPGRWLNRFETNFVDLAGDGGLPGQTAGRTVATVHAWLDAHGADWEAAVRIVAMDPSATYRRAVQDALPQARIVADHFHLARLANDAATRVRQRSPATSSAGAGGRTNPAWANRRRLLRARERLSERSFTWMWNELDADRPVSCSPLGWMAPTEAAHQPAQSGSMRGRRRCILVSRSLHLLSYPNPA